ncbi:MAG: WXG100 family type VII secretion target [Propionibacteriaceae bacterium]|jgi:WXG100 family type VII secretion target|nr:WXG100 family type VII secretion target [Propionibacteriaceae bacterium]
MSDVIKYPFQTLVDIGSDLIGVADKLQSRIDEFGVAVKRSQAVWEGDAADAFASAFTAWLAEATLSADELRAIGNILKAVRDRYRNIELEIEDQWRRDI